MLGRQRVVTYFLWGRAIVYVRMGFYRSAIDVVSIPLARRYRRVSGDAERSRFIQLVCETFSDALDLGKQGEIDPPHAALAMDRYERSMRAAA
jgi:hypothetical protein